MPRLRWPRLNFLPIFLSRRLHRRASIKSRSSATGWKKGRAQSTRNRRFGAFIRHNQGPRLHRRGTIREYCIESDNDQLCFDDVPPGHGKLWQRARKILRPTEEGFEERLEVHSGDGSFVPYYVVRMRKVGC